LKTRKTGSTKKKHNSLIAVAVFFGVIAAIASYLYYEKITTQQNEPQWVTSGPFSINKSSYKLGEYIFYVVSGLKPNEAGSIAIVTPKGDTYSTIPFNGTLKTDFKNYFKPNTQSNPKLCTPQDLVGTWKLIFDGVPYKPIKFEIINDWIPGSQSAMKPIENC
jgi:hypothetical protein